LVLIFVVCARKRARACNRVSILSVRAPAPRAARRERLATATLTRHAWCGDGREDRPRRVQARTTKLHRSQQRPTADRAGNSGRERAAARAPAERARTGARFPPSGAAAPARAPCAHALPLNQRYGTFTLIQPPRQHNRFGAVRRAGKTTAPGVCLLCCGPGTQRARACDRRCPRRRGGRCARRARALLARAVTRLWPRLSAPRQRQQPRRPRRPRTPPRCLARRAT
jgi:hypothetical protein